RVVEISLHGWQKRRLVVPDRARRGFPVDELRVTSATGCLILVTGTAQPHGDDVAVFVPMLHGGVLGNEDGTHGWLASSPPAGCQRGLPLRQPDASMRPWLPIGSRRRPVRIFSSTRTIPSTGTRGATRRSPVRGPKASPCCSP